MASSAPTWQQPTAMQESRSPHMTVTIGNPVERPRDYMVWSICNLVYANPFCLGLVALYFSVKARDMKAIGDLQRAREYGRHAVGLNIAALIMLVVLLVVIIPIVVLSSNSWPL